MLFSSYYYLSFMHCVFYVQSYADAAFASSVYIPSNYAKLLKTSKITPPIVN